MASIVIRVLLAFAAAQAFAQSNLLQITSPASGTMVYPGQTIVISVKADPSVSNVAIIGQDPLGFSQKTNGEPLQFELAIPLKTTVGKYDVSATGVGSNRSLVTSPPISLQVENPKTQFQIRTQPSLLRFRKPGEIVPLHVIGTFPDGSQQDVTHSVQVHFASENPQVVTVDTDGIVRATGFGSTHILVSNLSNSRYLVSTKVGQLAEMNNVGLGAMLTGSSQTFRWNGSNEGTAYRIDVGSTKGGHEYYQSGSLPKTTLSQTVNDLPTDGSRIYVTLCSLMNDTWGCNEYFYDAYAPGRINGGVISPAAPAR